MDKSTKIHSQANCYYLNGIIDKKKNEGLDVNKQQYNTLYFLFIFLYLDNINLLIYNINFFFHINIFIYRR